MEEAGAEDASAICVKSFQVISGFIGKLGNLFSEILPVPVHTHQCCTLQLFGLTRTVTVKISLSSSRAFFSSFVALTIVHAHRLFLLFLLSLC